MEDNGCRRNMGRHPGEMALGVDEVNSRIRSIENDIVVSVVFLHKANNKFYLYG